MSSFDLLSKQIPINPSPRGPSTFFQIGLWSLVIVLLSVVVWLQRPEAPDPVKAAEAAKGLGTIKPSSGDGLVLVGKLMLAFDQLNHAGAPSTPGPAGASPNPSQMFLTIADSMAGWEPTNPQMGPASAANPPKPRVKPMPPAERLRSTIIAAEVVPSSEVTWRLDNIQRDLDPTSPLVADVAILRSLIDLPSGVSVDQLPEEDKKGLIERHGWFGKLALSRGTPDSPTRIAASRDGTLLIFALIVVGGVIVLAILAGLVLLGIGLVSYRSLQARFIAPILEREWPASDGVITEDVHATAVINQSTPVIPSIDTLDTHPHTAGMVWLETVAVFLAGFLSLKVVAELVEHSAGKEAAAWASLGAQWLLVGTIFWPLVRGMSFARWKREIGWHTGRGVFREILSGVGAYLAAIPIYFCMALVVVAITYAIGYFTGEESALPEGNKIIELVGAGNPLLLVMIFLLATVWAPIVEESIFRGALYRHLRRRVGVVLAALGSGLVFAVMHGYAIQGLFMVGTLGFVFALMREWRGSLIANVTAHALHNASVLTMLIVILSLASA